MTGVRLTPEQTEALHKDLAVRMDLLRIMGRTSYYALESDFGWCANALRYIVTHKRQPELMPDRDYRYLLSCAAEYAEAARRMHAGYRTQRLMDKHNISRTTLWRHAVMVAAQQFADVMERREAA